MDDIGEKLRVTREAKHISLREAEDNTKIRMKYLIALEANDFDALPGRAYLIGFLRTYARFLGLNDEELVHILKTNLPTEVHREEGKGRVGQKKIKIRVKKPRLLFLIGVLLGIFLLGGIVSAFLGDQNSDLPKDGISGSESSDGQEPQKIPNGQNSLDKNPETSALVGTTENNTGINPETEINGVSVTVIVREDSCWIGVTIDGKKDYQGTLTAGDNRTFAGQEKIVIKYGNAGVVETITNGDRIYPVGAKNQVLTKEYPERN
ncbi:RodZ domain-containing protein [Dehalobacterium formicoaceticum]|uniref:DUF4115 domain-containing protein n=1 Tax=Dehalobacterium formicoaceticum TaxID=51515 RepID=A0ABT1Y4W1_9FIRM|nr:RodZ domain-containing protein [Dehalobacterium formicoaceticum]MCR6545915.1 DUF4115 domain-containing protein [Dehalobacterium formicoaceticum]